MKLGQSACLLLAAVTLPALATATGAKADSATDWYVELKRVAKYARISAQGGARGDDLRTFSQATADLARRVLDRNTKMPSTSAESTCMGALRDLEASLKLASSYQIYDAIVSSEDRRDRCLAEIQRR